VPWDQRLNVRIEYLNGATVPDAEPPQIAEVTTAWFDVIGADFAWVWPLMQQTAAPTAIEVIRRALAAGVLKFVDQPGQAAAWMAHSDSVSSVAIAPDGKTALSGDGSGSLKLWDLATGREIQRRNGQCSAGPGRCRGRAGVLCQSPPNLQKVGQYCHLLLNCERNKSHCHGRLGAVEPCGDLAGKCSGT
jgi:WD40 repeat protein